MAESNLLIILVVLLLLMAAAPRFMLFNVFAYLPKQSVWIKKISKQFLVVFLASFLVCTGVLFGASYLEMGRIPVIIILGFIGLISATLLSYRLSPLVDQVGKVNSNPETFEKILSELEFILDYEQREWIKSKEYAKLGKYFLTSRNKYKAGSAFLALATFTIGAFALYVGYKSSKLFSGFHPAGIFGILLGPMMVVFHRRQSVQLQKVKVGRHLVDASKAAY